MLIRIFTAAPVAVLLLLTTLLNASNALYFYLDTNAEKCLTEELPLHTMIVGHYRAEQLNVERNLYVENPALGIQISVDYTGTPDVSAIAERRIMDQRGASSGRYTFTAEDPGRYTICFSTNNTGWFSHEKARVHLDMVIGDSAEDEDSDRTHEKLSEMAMRVRDLNHRIADIRREQTYQRMREADFRDKSESTNSHVVWWTFAQIVVLWMTCAWQMRHLKGFFTAKKLV